MMLVTLGAPAPQAARCIAVAAMTAAAETHHE
jgi:hypothetical protein